MICKMEIKLNWNNVNESKEKDELFLRTLSEKNNPHSKSISTLDLPSEISNETITKLETFMKLMGSHKKKLHQDATRKTAKIYSPYKPTKINVKLTFSDLHVLEDPEYICTQRSSHDIINVIS